MTDMAAIVARLDDVDAKLQALVEERRALTPVLDAMGDALSAMAEQLEALTEAALAEEEGEALHSLDGGLEGVERDLTQEL